MWRQYLESLCHEENCFVTLTYKPGFEPRNPDHHPHVGHLEAEHLRLWLYRFRKACQPLRIRFFAVGEYGDQNGRPHYHLSLFGVSGSTLVARSSSIQSIAAVIAETWSKGLVHVAEFNELTAQYVAGYVTKKMTQQSDERLRGRPPEFSRQSRRPGIGANAMAIIAEAWLKGDVYGDPPTSLKLGKRNIPLGRYLLQKLRLAAGLTEEEISNLKSEVGYENSLKVRSLLADRIAASPLSPVTATDIYKEEVKQKILQVEHKFNLYKKRGPL